MLGVLHARLAREGKKMGEGEKWGVAMGGAHFKPDVRRWGTGRWGGTTRQVRAKGGCLAPTGRRRPGRQRPEADGRGRSARSCRMASAKQGSQGADVLAPTTVTSGGGLNPNRFQIQMDSNQVQIDSNFDRPKRNHPELQKFEIEYSFKYFERMNNFLHRNFFRFEMDFK
jgi:hypothetical protein